MSTGAHRRQRGRQEAYLLYVSPQPIILRESTFCVKFDNCSQSVKRKQDGTKMLVMPTTPRERTSRFLRPVPPPRPDEIMPSKRGRYARKRVVQAENFRKYMYLRRQLKPWSDAFRVKHGRTPSLVDVHQANIPGLMDRFVEYLEALDQLRC